MKKNNIIRLAIITLLLIISILNYTSPRTYSQQGFWIALNFEVEFNPDGTAIVIARLHPFSLEGESLFYNETIEKDLMEEQDETINDMILMFTRDPRTVKYKIIQNMTKDENDVTYCDAYNVGEMTKFQGAYKVAILIYLNTTGFITVYDSGEVKVKVRDSYTSRSPRSWIDVIKFTFNEGVELIEYSWEPDSAQGPTKKEENSLIWFNFNEPQAPDFYIFVLRFRSFQKVKKAVAIKAEIGNVMLEPGKITVRLQNIEGTGYIIVRVFGDNTDQTRKIYVSGEKEKEVSFPLLTEPSKLTIEIWSEGEKIQSYKVGSGLEVGKDKTKIRISAIIIKMAAVTLGIIGIIILAIGLVLRSKKVAVSEPLPSLPPYT